uniref:Dolichol-phosphate mannosyltransferase subunit 1 n=1 Tax=Meloidogyne incognita TaxID=6306 RepID=A0A914M770_MELIC
MNPENELQNGEDEHSRRPKYTILLPTYNEAENLPICIWLINKYLNELNYEVLIIDDNSPDGTQDIAKKLCNEFGNDKIILLTREGKLGLGSAYVFGLKQARGDFVILMDADLSHHPKHIPEMIALQNKNNVIGHADHESELRIRLFRTPDPNSTKSNSGPIRAESNGIKIIRFR